MKREKGLNAKLILEMNPNQETIENLTKLLREISLSRIKHLSKRPEVILADIEEEPLVFAHWMSFILLSGKNLRVLFKTHYMTESAKYFASRAYGVPQAEISQTRAVDFFREFCNLTAGNLKVMLSKINLNIGISLPILARGFDDIFYPRPNDSTVKYWGLNCGEEKVYCSTHIAILDSFKLVQSSVDENELEGDVEFL